MTHRVGLPGEREVAAADLMADVQQNGVHPWVEEGAPSPEAEHVNEQVPAEKRMI